MPPVFSSTRRVNNKRVFRSQFVLADIANYRCERDVTGVSSQKRKRVNGDATKGVHVHKRKIYDTRRPTHKDTRGSFLWTSKIYRFRHQLIVLI